MSAIGRLESERSAEYRFLRTLDCGFSGGYVGRSADCTHASEGFEDL